MKIMNENIIKFYLAANKLKDVIRTGWEEVGIPSEKRETVAEHVCGTMALTLGIVSEKNYQSLDLVKVFKMILLKELTKLNNEQSVISKEQKKENNRNTIVAITNGLKDQNELLAIYDEAETLESPEAKFALYVSKLESDLQAKKYELDGDFTLENAKKDIENYPEDIKAEIKPQVTNAADGWILFDRRYYNNDETFTELSKDIQKIG